MAVDGLKQLFRCPSSRSGDSSAEPVPVAAPASESDRSRRCGSCSTALCEVHYNTGWCGSSEPACCSAHQIPLTFIRPSMPSDFSFSWHSIFLLVATVLLLNTQLAAASPLLDVQLDFNHALMYNPSIVHFQDSFVSAVKQTVVSYSGDKSWWNNTVYICDAHRITSAFNWNCNVFQPWGENDYAECLFPKWERGETIGLGDTKLWYWPGHGVYAIFGRKPPQTEGKERCWTLNSYAMHLALVKPDPALPPGSDWDLKQPLKLELEAKHYPKGSINIKEKNWMPFSYWDRSNPESPVEHLYVVYSIQPHKIHELLPSGEVIPRYHSWTKLFDRFGSVHIHGGPPIVYVPEGLLGPDSKPFYLGVLHTIRMVQIKQRGSDTKTNNVKMYRHFAYRFSAQPPFSIEAVSDELPLVYSNDTDRPHAMYITFAVGFHLRLPSNHLEGGGGPDAGSNQVVAKTHKRLTGAARRQHQHQHHAHPHQHRDRAMVTDTPYESVTMADPLVAGGSRYASAAEAEASGRMVSEPQGGAIVDAAGDASGVTGDEHEGDAIVDASGDPREHGIIHISYGSADTHPRVLTLTLPDLMAMFTGKMEHRKEFYGQPLPTKR